MTRRDRWVAPQEDGGILIDPPLDRVEELLETNRRHLDSSSALFLGQPLREVREQVRAGSACDTRGKWFGTELVSVSEPIVATGHQPDLFHPGVWLKNFAVNGIARRMGCFPLHVTVDSDTLKSTSILFPQLHNAPEAVCTRAEAYDKWKREEPLLNRRVDDVPRFREFARTTRPLWQNWPFVPVLPKFWDQAGREFDRWTERRETTPVLIARLFRSARCSLEQSMGCENSDMLLSRSDRGSLIGHIVSDLPRFRAAHNDAVRRYRKRHGLRSHTHPVPELGSDGDFLEAPFWWHDRESNQRHRLFASSSGETITLRAGRERRLFTFARRELSEWPLHWQRDGGRILTRALTTTLFTRLCLADLFIHGIGGAKYDEVTDDIIRRYFGIEPPEYMVVSGTLRLPFPTFPATVGERRRLARKVRDLRWRPEQFLDHANDLVEQKRRWLAREPLTRDERRARYRELLHLTEALRPTVADQVSIVERDIERCDRELAANEILTRRDYPFVLYPESKLRPFLTQLL